MAAGDQEKQAALRELQIRYDSTLSKLRMVESQRRQSDSTLRRAAYTAQHLNELPDDVNTYAAVGKAYFLEPKALVMSKLEKAVKASSAELKAALETKEGLEKSQVGLTAELKELMGGASKA